MQAGCDFTLFAASRAWVVSVVVLAGCAGGSSGDTPCRTAWQAKCDRACACQPGPQCAFAPGAWTDDGGVTVVPGSVVDSESDCRTVLERINCGASGEGVPGADYEACKTDIAQAECEDFEGDGQQYTGMAPVKSCDFL